MFRITPSLVKCPHCRHFIWIEEAETIGQSNRIDDVFWREDIPIYKNVSEEDYYLALETGLTETAEKILYLRMRAWWAANDRFRWRNKKETTIQSDAARQNMESLFSSLTDEKEQERLTKAELARQLGNFEEAKRLLCFPFSQRHQHVARRIKELILQRSIRVGLL